MENLRRRGILIELKKSVDGSLKLFKRKIDSVYLFGSFANGKFNNLSDVDVCFFGEYSWEDKIKIISLFDEIFDVSFFQDLPIWIRIRVFREGKRIYTKGVKKEYAYLFSTIREYEDFLPIIKNRMVRYGN